MGRTAKKSDLEKTDLKDFNIGLTEARELKITKDDLKGIKEIIPNSKYKIRATTGDRKAETFNGTLLEAIKRKKELNNISSNIKENKKTIDDNNMMFMDGVSLYIDSLFEREDRNDLDINTVFDHIRKINLDISDFFGKYRLNEVDSELIEKFITSMRKRTKKNNPDEKLSEQSIANYLRTLNAILNFLVTKKKIPENPYNAVTNKPTPKKAKKELNYFQIDEAKYALKCLDKFANIRLKTFMNIIFSLGCRREECCGLRWCDIDFNNNEVNFNYAQTSSVPIEFLQRMIERDKRLNNNKNNDYSRVRTKALKTDNSYRTNYISNVAISYLKKYYQFKIACGIDIKPDDFVFTTYREGRNCFADLNENDFINDNKAVDPNKLSAEWRAFKKEYNIKDVDLHRIRHTVANILEKKGVPKKDIAKMLGNTERVLEEFYTHVDVAELKRLRNTIDIELFNDIEYIDLSIDLIAKIINEFPMDSLNEDELKTLDLISYNPVSSDNYESTIRSAKDIILTTDGSLNYFIDDNSDSLKIKLETYKKFSGNKSIKVQKEKDISIKRDILSF